MTEIEGDERAQPAGQMDTGRVLALSDGVFAIAATLLVLELHLPEGTSEANLAERLHDLIPAVGGYGLSYLLIGLLWLGHHRQFRGFTQISARVARLNLMFLALVSVLPFVTSLLRYDSAIAVQIYAALIAVIFLLDVAMAVVAERHGHHADPASARRHMIRTVVTAAVFALSIPVALIPDTGPSLAKYFWLLLIPARFLFRWLNKRP